MKNRRTPTVAVLYGGIGKEHSVSLLGCDFIRKHIDRERFAVIFVKISRSGEWLVEFKNKYKTATPMRKNGRFGLCVGHRFHPTDAIFPMLHGDFGEDGRLQGLCESLGAPLVGCKTHAGAVASAK